MKTYRCVAALPSGEFTHCSIRARGMVKAWTLAREWGRTAPWDDAQRKDIPEFMLTVSHVAKNGVILEKKFGSVSFAAK